jgi:Domain of unknown function (DUF4276)
MLDFYGLGKGFPGKPAQPLATSLDEVRSIEQAIKADICERIPEFRPDLRLIPYLALHEFEALLFSDPDALAGAIKEPGKAMNFHGIRNQFRTPEDIDDGPDTAPSKRILSIYPAFARSSKEHWRLARWESIGCVASANIFGCGSSNWRHCQSCRVY